jgi:hypothetical protein
MTDLERLPAKWCAVCARVLSEVSTVDDHDHVGWKHGIIDIADHPAVPVDAWEIHAKGRCDFCSDEIAGRHWWVLPVADFVVGTDEHGLEHRNRGDYAMCDGCQEVYNLKSPGRLITRVMAHLFHGASRKVVAATVGLALDHVVGEPFEAV